MSPRLASDAHVALATYTTYLLNISGHGSLEDDQYVAILWALGDYFSSSYLNDPKVGAVISALIDPKQGYLRNLNTSISFAEIGKERIDAHAIGEVWSGAFWAMREKVGRARLDRVLVQAWKSYRKKPGRTVAQSYVDSLAGAADKMLSPSDATAVRTVLDLRGFPSPEA